MQFRDTWVAQSVECPTRNFSSGGGLQVVWLSPELGSVLGVEPAWDSLSPSLSICPSPCSRSVSPKTTNKNKKNVQFSGFRYIYRWVQPSTHTILGHFHRLPPQKNPLAINSQSSCPTTSPKQLLTYFLSMDFPTLDFHMNRVVQHVVLCIWLISLNIMLSDL